MRSFALACLAGIALAWLWLREAPEPGPAPSGAPRAEAPARSPTEAEAGAPSIFSRLRFHRGDGPGEADLSRAEAEAHYALGTRLLERGDYYAAASHLTLARESGIDLARICELLAITYDRLNMTPDLLSIMDCLEREARRHESAREWYEHLTRHLDVENDFAAAASDHFVASFPDSGHTAAAIGDVLDILERSRRETADLLGLATSRIVPVVVYEGEQFAEATAKPHWALGLYDGKIRVAIDTLDRRPEIFEIAIGHEYVHALTHEVTGTRLPAWFREGLADTVSRHDTRLAPDPAWRLGPRGPVFAMTELNGEFLGLPEDLAAAAYRHSHALVSRLVTEAGWEPLEDLLLDLQADPTLDFEAAFAGVYGESPEAYVDRWYHRVAH